MKILFVSLDTQPVFTHNVAICGRSEMALFVRLFAQNVTAHGDPQDGLVMFFLHLELPCPIYRFCPLSLKSIRLLMPFISAADCKPS